MPEVIKFVIEPKNEREREMEIVPEEALPTRSS
jgi:hypothetical protein